MRSLVIVLAVLGFATSANAAAYSAAVLSNQCPIFMGSRFALDAHGRCRDDHGRLAPRARCAAPLARRGPPQCRDPRSHRVIACRPH